jgi:hypothetical protein
MRAWPCHQRCRDAKREPWQGCICGCRAAGHPQDHASQREGIYVPFPGARGQTGRWTAIPFDPNDLGVPAVAFGLAVNAFKDLQVVALIGAEVCLRLTIPGPHAGATVEYALNQKAGKPVNIPAKQEPSRQMLNLASKIRRGAGARSAGEKRVIPYLASGCSVGANVPALIGLTLCGFLGDTRHAKPVSDAALPLLLPLLVNHLRNAAVLSAVDLCHLERELQTIESRTRNLFGAVTPLLPRHVGRSAHAGCRLHERLVTVLAAPKTLSARAVNHVGRSVEASARSGGVNVADATAEGRFAQGLIDGVVQAAGSFNPGGVLVMARLSGVMSCPDISSHKEVVDSMLRPLAAVRPNALVKQFVADAIA